MHRLSNSSRNQWFGLTFGALLALSLFHPFSAQAAWNFDRLNGTSLVFKDEKSGKSETLKTDVGTPNFVAVLSDPESGTAYALFEGKACPKCDVANTSLFLQRIDGKGKATSFVYPGRITDPKKNALVYEGRLFYGHCLPSVKAGIVAHQREVVDRRGSQKSVLIAEPGPQYVYEVLLENRIPNLKTTLDLVKQKSCVEIAGRSRSVLKKPLDLTPRKGLDDDEEDEEANEKAAASAPANTD
ncbi:MAG: hypothetical protein H7301_02390 [Cryobacterium sp.]|nr:hypothetical protein [Oligoflexia bacterium]